MLVEAVDDLLEATATRAAKTVQLDGRIVSSSDPQVDQRFRGAVRNSGGAFFVSRESRRMRVSSLRQRRVCCCRCAAGATLVARAAAGRRPGAELAAAHRPDSRRRGTSVTPAFRRLSITTRNGSQRVIVGYFNRNTKQEFDIPAGPNNRIEPGPADPGPADALQRRPAVGACSRSSCRRTSAPRN